MWALLFLVAIINNVIPVFSTIYNRNEIVDIILPHVNVNIQNKFGNTALHIAVNFSNQYIIDKLQQYNANNNIKSLS